MEAAKEAVRSFTSKQGHTTDVDEVVNPAITRETVKPSRHEEFTEAVDREVHQHHYHTTVQPISHREVIPERHTHQMLPIEKKEFHHGDHDAVKRGVSAELGQFASTSITHETQHTRASVPAVSGEHVHHHVHETVQPVIHKETIQPEVVHTTLPIHEVHHAEATHHGMSALPMKTLDEFTKAGGLLKGSDRHTHEEYTGAPRPYNKDLQTSAEKVLHTITGHHGTGHGMGSGIHHTSGLGTGTTTTTATSTHTTAGLGSGSHHTTGLGTEDRGLGTSGLGTEHRGLGTTGLGTEDRGLGATSSAADYRHGGLATESRGLGTTGLGSETHHTSGLASTEHSRVGDNVSGGGLLNKGTKRDSGVGERENVSTY